MGKSNTMYALNALINLKKVRFRLELISPGFDLLKELKLSKNYYLLNQ